MPQFGVEGGLVGWLWVVGDNEMIKINGTNVLVSSGWAIFFHKVRPSHFDDCFWRNVSERCLSGNT